MSSQQYDWFTHGLTSLLLRAKEACEVGVLLINRVFRYLSWPIPQIMAKQVKFCLLTMSKTVILEGFSEIPREVNKFTLFEGRLNANH